MANQNKTDIGLIGLAVMGENLALNMESRGWHVSIYNRTVAGVEEGVVDRFMNGRVKAGNNDRNIEGFTDDFDKYHQDGIYLSGMGHVEENAEDVERQ